MYLVAGITGKTGAAAASTLLAGGRKVRAIVRDKAKAAAWAARGVELVEGDMGDSAALEKAMAGVAGAYLLVPPNVGHPDPVGEYAEVALAVRRAALAAGLPRLVFLSSEGAQHNGGNGPIRGSHQGETILPGAAARLTFLRASFFQENWQGMLGLAQAQGILPTMFADVDNKRSMIATADIGRVAAGLLTEASPPALVELASGTLYSARDAANAFAAALGKPVAPVQPPRDQWHGILTGAGLPEPYAALIAEMYDGINSGHVAFTGQGRQEKGGVGLQETVRSWVK